MRIAIQGCSHGDLDTIYSTLQSCQSRPNQKPIDLLLCCGDFQAIRSNLDRDTLACPVKYRKLGDFWRYYKGEKKAPVLTIVIGGNHEASSHLWELFHGGWLAPDIYYLGHAGCVVVDGWLRIAGASGIFKINDYHKGYSERVPYNDSSIRSAYHTREFNILKLLQLNNEAPLPGIAPKPVDIFMSHDWPNTIERYGDLPKLMRDKPWFQKDADANTLGSPPLFDVLTALKPPYWFAAHMHCKFPALIEHAKFTWSQTQQKQGRQPRTQTNPDEIAIDDEDEGGGLKVEVAKNPDEIDLGIDEDEDAVTSGKGSSATGTAVGIDVRTGEKAIDESVEEVKAERSLEKKDGSPRVNPSTLAQKVADSSLSATSSSPNRPKKRTRADVESDSGSESGERRQKKRDENNTGNTLDREAEKEVTRFLALSKPGPGGGFMQIVDIPASTPHAQAKTSTSPRTPTLSFDPQWLAITRVFHPVLSLSRNQHPNLSQSCYRDPKTIGEAIRKERNWVEENLVKPKMEGKGKGSNESRLELLEIEDIQRFVHTDPPAHDEMGVSENDRLTAWNNPQTQAFCDWLQIPNMVNPSGPKPPNPMPAAKPSKTTS